MARFNRSDFCDKVSVDGITECDLIMNNFDKFQLKRQYKFYRCTDDDLKRPDLLSLKLYGTQDFWWIIGKVNAIDDFWNDLSSGSVLLVPDILDIEDFYLAVRNL